MDLTISKKNEVFLKIDSKEPHIFCELSDIFTFEVPGAKFMPSVSKQILGWKDQII